MTGAVSERGPFKRVVEFGSADVNGSVRHLFGQADYLGIDQVAAPGVDLVADAADWEPEASAYDGVVCCETFEHTPRWREILATAADALRLGGVLIVTAACDPRAPHSAVDGWDLRSGEFYENVDPIELAAVLHETGFDAMVTTRDRGDVYAVATRVER